MKASQAPWERKQKDRFFFGGKFLTNFGEVFFFARKVVEMLHIYVVQMDSVRVRKRQVCCPFGTFSFKKCGGHLEQQNEADKAMSKSIHMQLLLSYFFFGSLPECA